MPSVSKKQHNFMAAVANNPKFAKKAGVSSAVGKEFLTADKGKTFKQGGAMKKVRKFAEGGVYGEAASAGSSMGSAAAKKLKQGDLSDLKKAAMNAGLSVGQMASGMGAGLGSKMGKSAAAGLAGMGRKKSEASNEDSDYKKGGKVHSDIAKDKPMMKKVAAKAVKGHEKRMHGMKSGGMAYSKGGQLSKADGCATKGKSKGTMVKMKNGGAC
jgi:hypothetical protein